jgi:hypothetical protein
MDYTQFRDGEYAFSNGYGVKLTDKFEAFVRLSLTNKMFDDWCCIYTSPELAEELADNLRAAAAEARADMANLQAEYEDSLVTASHELDNDYHLEMERGA